MNAETGAVERIQGVSWPPRVSGREIWGARHTFVRFGGLHPDEIDRDNLPAGLAAEPTEEVVQLPPEQEAAPLGAVAPLLTELSNHHEVLEHVVFALELVGELDQRRADRPGGGIRRAVIEKEKGGRGGHLRR